MKTFYELVVESNVGGQNFSAFILRFYGSDCQSQFVHVFYGDIEGF